MPEVGISTGCSYFRFQTITKTLMAWKPYKPVLEISADWIFRLLIGGCTVMLWEMRTDISTLKINQAITVTDVAVSKNEINNLKIQVDKLEVLKQGR